MIFIVEGEKDVHSLTSFGQCATCNPGGAGKWQDCYNESLDGADVVVLPDNDEPGRLHAESIAKSLLGHARTVRVLELPGLAKKGDVTDWIDAGGTADELLRLVEAAPEWAQTPESVCANAASIQSSVAGFACTDLGNAERFVQINGQNVRYVADAKSFIIWDDFRWAPDETLRIEKLAKQTIRSIHAEAVNATTDSLRKEISKWAISSESASRLHNMLALMRSELAIVSDVLDTDQYLLCVKNGTLDLRSAHLLTPLRENLITKQNPIVHDPVAQCPAWIKFLERVQPDTKAREYLQRCIGYSLSGDVSEHCIFFLYGQGRNGKSVTLEILKALVGKDYFKKVDAELLMYRSSRNAAEVKADLIGKRVVSSTEIGEGQRLNESLIKDLSGGDTQDSRKLFCQSRDFKVGFHIWLYGNYKPTIKGKDLGIWSRIRLIPFSEVIPEAEQDKHLVDKLLLELPGILNWAVQGFQMWQKDGLHEPDVIVDATNEYRKEQDALQEFMADCCVMIKTASVSKKALWDAYQSWSKATGEEGYETQRLFNEEIRRIPGVKDGNLNRMKAWKGLGLLDTMNTGNGETDMSGDRGDQGDQVSVTFPENSLQTENSLQGKTCKNAVSPVSFAGSETSVVDEMQDQGDTFMPASKYYSSEEEMPEALYEAFWNSSLPQPIIGQEEYDSWDIDPQATDETDCTDSDPESYGKQTSEVNITTRCMDWDPLVEDEPSSQQFPPDTGAVDMTLDEFFNQP